MKLGKITVGPVQTNCYIAVNEETSECVIMDPGAEGDRIEEFINAKSLKPVVILLTHAHFDHIMAVDYLRRTYGIKALISNTDEELLADPYRNGFSGDSGLGLEYYYARHDKTAGSGAVIADGTFKDQDVLSYAGIDFKVIATPGHTKGSVCFYVEKDKILFAGDTLFLESAGRTDLPTGSEKAIIESIREVLFKLPEDVVVLSGHGPRTNIGYEKKNNIYAGW